MHQARLLDVGEVGALPAVRATFVRIYQDAKGVGAEAAEAWAERVERETGRYVADVFA